MHIPATSMLGIIREAIKLPAKNKRLMLQVVFLVFTPISLLVLLHSVIAGPLLQKVEDSYEKLELDQKDLIALVALEFPFILCFCALFSVGTMIMVLASSAVYTAKAVHLKELLLRITSSWSKAMSSWLHLSFLLIVFVAILAVSLHLTDFMGDSTVMFASSWLIGLLSAILFPYFASIPTLGLIVSVLEHHHRAKAFAKAQRLVTHKKLQGYLLMLTMQLISIPIYVLFYVTTADDDDEIGWMTRYAFTSVASLLFCLTNSFTMLVYTLFYFQCKESYGEEEIELEPGFHSIAPAVDSSA